MGDVWLAPRRRRARHRRRTSAHAKQQTAPSTSLPRAASSRAAALIDAYRAASPASDGNAEEVGVLFAEAQAA